MFTFETPAVVSFEIIEPELRDQIECYKRASTLCTESSMMKSALALGIKHAYQQAPEKGLMRAYMEAAHGLKQSNFLTKIEALLNEYSIKVPSKHRDLINILSHVNMGLSPHFFKKQIANYADPACSPICSSEVWRLLTGHSLLTMQLIAPVLDLDPKNYERVFRELQKGLLSGKRNPENPERVWAEAEINERALLYYLLQGHIEGKLPSHLAQKLERSLQKTTSIQSLEEVILLMQREEQALEGKVFLEHRVIRELRRLLSGSSPRTIEDFSFRFELNTVPSQNDLTGVSERRGATKSLKNILTPDNGKSSATINPLLFLIYERTLLSSDSVALDIISAKVDKELNMGALLAITEHVLAQCSESQKNAAQKTIETLRSFALTSTLSRETFDADCYDYIKSLIEAPKQQDIKMDLLRRVFDGMSLRRLKSRLETLNQKAPYQIRLPLEALTEYSEQAQADICASYAMLYQWFQDAVSLTNLAHPLQGQEETLYQHLTSYELPKLPSIALAQTFLREQHQKNLIKKTNNLVFEPQAISSKPKSPFRL